MAKTIVKEFEKCLACKTCELACALEHSETKVLERALGESPSPQSRVSVEAVETYAVPMHCQHCQDAPCMTVCPSGALYRAGEDQPVLLDAKRCIGCRFCLLACPFGVITPSRDGGVMIKCDLCRERLAAGEEPACVSSCPTKALHFVEVDEYVRVKRSAAARRALEPTGE